jgi:hypothetical protein
MQIRKPLAERIMQSPVEERLRLLVDEILRVRDEPSLPRRHPNAAKQLQAKAEATAALELFGRKMQPLMKTCHQELLALQDAKLPLLGASARAELKRWGRTMLLFYDAHWGPGGPYEGQNEENE